jgi:hypothetical protein
MNATELLANVRIASPCSARWEDMTGDERSRFCAQCQKHVYDLSAMTADEAAALIREKEGKLCVQFFRRRDGSILTADCPIPAMQFVRRLRRLAAACVALLFAYFVALAAIQSSFSPRSARSRVGQKWDQVMVAFKTWINPPPPAPVPPPPIPGMVIIGEMCVPAPRATNALPLAPPSSLPPQ